MKFEQAVDNVTEIAQGVGFETVGQVSTHSFSVRSEVRDMCAADACRHYGRNWCCPPACGSLSEYRAQISERNVAILVQTVGQLEDSFDFESMQEVGRIHSERFRELMRTVRDVLSACVENTEADDSEEGISSWDPSPLFLGAGECTVCTTCTYPDAPCRFPEKSFVSMEAAGLVVSEVCTAAGIPYNHGSNTISFTGCVLL